MGGSYISFDELNGLVALIMFWFCKVKLLLLSISMTMYYFIPQPKLLDVFMICLITFFLLVFNYFFNLLCRHRPTRLLYLFMQSCVTVINSYPKDNQYEFSEFLA